MQWEYGIFRQLTSIYRKSISDGIFEQTMMNFKNPAHGFCAEGSHLADSWAIFENSTWFESSSDSSNCEEGRFRDDRFSIVADSQSNSCSGPGNYIFHALFGLILFLLFFSPFDCMLLLRNVWWTRRIWNAVLAVYKKSLI